MLSRRLLSLALPLILLASCQSLRGHREPLFVPIHTDSADIGAEFHGNAYVAKIGFAFANNTGGPISRVGCGDPGWPEVEKKVNGRWVPVYYQIYLSCRTLPDFFLENGASYRQVVSFMAFEPGHRIEPELLVDSIDGMYRLHWGFATGRVPDAKGARTVELISNEFRMTLRR
jgi:hypothetical protein